jgi:hypothetical protein
MRHLSPIYKPDAHHCPSYLSMKQKNFGANPFKSKGGVKKKGVKGKQAGSGKPTKSLKGRIRDVERFLKREGLEPKVRSCQRGRDAGCMRAETGRNSGRRR